MTQDDGIGGEDILWRLGVRFPQASSKAAPVLTIMDCVQTAILGPLRAFEH